MGIIANKLQAASTTSSQGGVPESTPTGGGVVSRALAKQNAPKEPGFVQSVAQSIAKPFLGMFSQARDIATSVGDLGTGIKDAAQGKQVTVPDRPNQSEFDYGYLGKQKSFGAATPDKEGADAIMRGAGAGAGMASNIPVARVGTAVAKGFIPKALELAKEGAVSGGLFGAGSALQDDKSFGEAVVEGGVNALGGAILGPTIAIPGALKNKIMKPTEQMLENRLLEKFQKGIRPTITGGKATTEGLEKYNKNVISAVKTISENEPNLVFTNADGEAVRGKVPTSIKELMDAGEQTKKSIFDQYDALAKEAGGKGLNVELAPISKELDGVINNEALQLTNPRAIDYAMQLQERLMGKGKITAGTAQDVIQNYNKSLEAFYRNPTYDNASHVAIDALVANQMRKHLDEGIEGLTGKAYQELKNKYGALKAIEKDVIKAHLRDERRNVKGLIDFSDILSGGQLVHGILSMNPATIGSSLTQKAIASFYKSINDPNKAIQKVFEVANKLPGAAKKDVKPRLQLPAPKSNIRSEVYNQNTIPLNAKSESARTNEMVAKFGKQYEKQPLLQLPAGNPNAVNGPTIPQSAPKASVSAGFPDNVPQRSSSFGGPIDDVRAGRQDPYIPQNQLPTIEAGGGKAKAKIPTVDINNPPKVLGGLEFKKPQRNLVSQTMNPIANKIPSTGETASNIKNSKIGTIPPTLPEKSKKSSPKNPKGFIDAKTAVGTGVAGAGAVAGANAVKNGDLSGKETYVREKEPEKVYTLPDRKVKVNEADLKELGAILFGEVGNRPTEKKLLEAKAIANVALNRAEATGKTLLEVLREPKQFQALDSKQYKMYRDGTTDAVSQEKVKVINDVLDLIRNGKLDNTAPGKSSYAHLKDNTLKLYKDWSEQKGDLANIK